MARRVAVLLGIFLVLALVSPGWSQINQPYSGSGYDRWRTVFQPFDTGQALKKSINQPAAPPPILAPTQPSTPSVTQPGSKPDNQSASLPANQINTQPFSQPNTLPLSQPFSQPATQPLSQPASQPYSQQGNLPTGLPTAQPSQ